VLEAGALTARSAKPLATIAIHFFISFTSSCASSTSFGSAA